MVRYSKYIKITGGKYVFQQISKILSKFRCG